MRPLIAVPGRRTAPGEIARWQVEGVAAPASVLRMLHRADGVGAVLLPRRLDRGEPAEELAGFAGLLLLGGPDVDPARYGARPHLAVYGVDPMRDEFETALVRAALDLGRPVLAICRGLQVLNVALGGTLTQHLPDLPGPVDHGTPGRPGRPRHAVTTASGSRVAEATGAARLSCSSYHHQAIDRLAGGLTATAWTKDGVIEAAEAPDGWVLGVQWHPEDDVDDPEYGAAQQRLVDAFVAQAARTCLEGSVP